MDNVPLFKDVEKPIIGVVHLKPLPGTPLYKGDLGEILERALKDAEALYAGGVDGIIVENYGDKPFTIRVKNPLTLTAFTIVAYEVRRKFNDIYLGVNILRNSGVEAFAVAYNIGADFIRVNNLCQVLVSSEGVIYPIARELIGLRERLRAQIKVLADINVKHAYSLDKRAIEEIAKDCTERCLADALIVTGPRTGAEVDVEELFRVKKAVLKPVIVGSGVNIENIDRFWKIADGFIIGSFFKKDGKTENPVDYGRVLRFMNYIKSLRRKY